jgi:hypothetical protein
VPQKFSIFEGFFVAVVFSLGVAAAVFCFFFLKKEDALREGVVCFQ